MLDVECFTYLNKALESPIAPIVVLASNRGMAAVRGADDLVAAHGVPPDFLTRLLIIPTHPYDADEIKRIVRIRATTEGVQIADAAVEKIAEHGVRISLRYCLQLLTPARYVSLSLSPFFFFHISVWGRGRRLGSPWLAWPCLGSRLRVCVEKEGRGGKKGPAHVSSIRCSC